MSTSSRLGLLAVALAVLAGCAKAPPSHSAFAAATASADTQADERAAVAQRATRHAFAALPDRGELLAYAGQQVRRDGAYTWHRAGLSEAYALRAIADGHLRVRAPSGQLLDFKYDRHIEHPSGDWTWIGHLPGHPGQQSIITFGENAAFGSIAQPGQLPLRLTVRGGTAWLVETDGAQVAGIVNSATRPQRPDFFVPPGKRRVTAAGPSMASAPATASAGTATANTVDVVIGYTPGFASINGGNSGAVTRLNFLVDVANAAYKNSGVSATVRLVATVPVSYTDTTTNDSTLEQLTGYDSTNNTQTTPDPAFNALRAARDQYGADLVSLARSFHDPENGGCGIAWLIGGGQSGVATSDSFFGYSVISDGTDVGTDGKTYFCHDETLAHEMGHNMGAAHDIATSKGDNGVLDADEYGAYPYSFGYKTTSTTGNFYTVMAYGDTGQQIFRIFSDPRSTFCDGYPCGNATNADNARTLTQTIPIIATFRATVVSGVGGPVASDFNGDGISDILWRNASSGLDTIWRSANVNLRTNVTQVADPNWKVVGVGDFNGDGAADILWRNATSGSNAIWRSGNSATPQAITAVTNLAWQVAGVGDFNADGKADILWRNASSGSDSIWLSGNYGTQQVVDSVTDTNWTVAAAADFDGDGKADILWRNGTTGADTLWSAGSAAQRKGVAPVTDLRWKVVGAGDFNGDGVSDILWRNATTGANAIWQSANVNTRQAIDSMAGSAWTIAEVADFNGDGKADVLWRNLSSGADTIWLTGNAATAQAVASVTDLSWKVVP